MNNFKNKRWSADEIQYCDQLLQGDKEGHLAWDIVANRVNELFKNNRSASSCKCAMRRFYNKIYNKKPFNYYEGI